MNPEGRGRVENEVSDASFLLQAGIAGIPALIGETEWGEHGKSVLVGSIAEYRKFFGGSQIKSTFPLQIERMLRRGSAVRVTRLGSYGNPNDPTTIQGFRSNGYKEILPAAAIAPIWTGALGYIVNTAINPNVSLWVNGSPIASVSMSGGAPFATNDAAVNYFATTFNALANGYTITPANDGNVGTVTVTGTAGTAQNLDFVKVVASNAAITPFAELTTEGADAVPYAEIDFSAKTTGAWGNKLSIEITKPASEQSGFVDVTLRIDGFPELTTTVSDIPTDVTTVATLTETTDRLNEAFSPYAIVESLDGDLSPIPAYNFTGGTEPFAYSIFDYKGSTTAKTGIHAFDDDTDFLRIGAPMLADPEFDAYLMNYVIQRGDCRAWLRTPMFVDGRTAVDYRKGTGIYTHNPVDNWRASMVFGDIATKVPSQNDPTILVDGYIHALTDVLANASLKDGNTFNWFATAGAKRGKIPNNDGVRYNLGTGARSTEFNLVDKAGINAAIKDADFGTVYWGNGTMQIAKTLLSHENIAELLIYLSRVINPIAKGELFDPNDPVTWRNIYKRVDVVMTFVQDNRGVYGYEYQGDQFVDNVADVVVNTTAGLDAGKYEFLLFIKPTPAMKYVGIKTVVTNSGASFELL